MAYYNPWESAQQKAARIKNEVMTHFSYHHMYGLCNEELYHRACDELKRNGLARNFYNITGMMKKIYVKENNYGL